MSKWDLHIKHITIKKNKNTENIVFFLWQEDEVCADFHFSWRVSEPPQKESDYCTHQFNPTAVTVNFCLHHVHVINFPRSFFSQAKECIICNQSMAITVGCLCIQK